MIATVNLRTDHIPKFDSATLTPASTGETDTNMYTHKAVVLVAASSL